MLIKEDTNTNNFFQCVKKLFNLQKNHLTLDLCLGHFVYKELGKLYYFLFKLTDS